METEVLVGVASRAKMEQIPKHAGGYSRMYVCNDVTKELNITFYDYCLIIIRHNCANFHTLNHIQAVYIARNHGWLI